MIPLYYQKHYYQPIFKLCSLRGVEIRPMAEHPELEELPGELIIAPGRWRLIWAGIGAGALLLLGLAYHSYELLQENFRQIAIIQIRGSVEESAAGDGCRIRFRKEGGASALALPGNMVDRIELRLISTNPDHQRNFASPDEAEAVKAFRWGAEEFFLRRQDGKSTRFLYMVPVRTSPGCGECHPGQRNIADRIAGAVSASFDITAMERKILFQGFLTTMAILAATAGSLALLLHILRVQKAVPKAYDAIKTLSTIDQPTRLLNRRNFFKRAQAEWERLVKERLAGSMVIVDIDHFKRINHKYGYPAGDEVLKQVADILREHTRKSDIVGRYGGEEFVLLLPETNIAQARRLAEKLREMLATSTLTLPNSHPVRLTASIGVAGLVLSKSPGERQTLDGWFACADEAVHEATRNGGDQVAVHQSAETGAAAGNPL